MNNYKEMGAIDICIQRKEWIDRYADPVIDMLDYVLDALGADMVEGHSIHRILIVDSSILLMRSDIIGRCAKKSGTLYRVMIDPTVTLDGTPDFKGWKYQPMYFLVGVDEIGELNYSSGKKPEYHITPGDWITNINTLIPQAKKILQNAFDKQDREKAKELYDSMALEIAKEIKIEQEEK